MNSISKFKNYLPVIIIIFVCLFAIGQTIYSRRISQHLFTEHRVLTTNLRKASNQIAIAHLWLEEYLADDTSIDIKKVMGLYENGLALLDESMTNEVLTLHPSISKELKNLRVLIIVFTKMAKKRVEEFESSGTGTDIDQYFDDAFRELQLSFNKIFSVVSAHFIDEEKKAHLFNNIITLIWLLTITFTSVLLYKNEIRRKKSEEAILESSRHLENSQRVANLGTYTLNISSGLWTSSVILDELFGIKDLEYMRNLDGWVQIIHPAEREEMLDYFKNHVLSGGSKFDKEYRIIRMDKKEERWVHGLGELVLDEGHNFVEMIGTIQDITERKKAEEILIKAKEEAENATELKDKFVNIVTHDLLSPFTSIVGMMEVLREDPELKLNSRQRDLMDQILSSSGAMVSMIIKMLDISRFKTGKIELKPKFFDAQVISETVLGNVRFRADKKGIILVNEVPEGTRLYADKTFITEVILNLVSNAVKFCDKGATITLFVPPDRSTTIAVKDTGRGIDDDLVDDIFKPEIKTSTLGTSGEEGTGLGLPYSHDIMLSHGGELTVKNTIGEGCVFYAELPGVTPKILIVDDEKIVRRMFKLFVKELEVDVIEAENGREALESIKNNSPHLIICDIIMPVMDGFEFLKEIKGNDETKSIPVIAITADEKMETRNKIIRMGADDFVAKPFKKEEFLPRIKKFII